MPSLQEVQVLLVERGTGRGVEGGGLTYDDAPGPRSLPCTLFLSPGNHTLTASHPTRTVCLPNPCPIEVVIRTDPGAGPQVVTFEVEPASGGAGRAAGGGAA